MKFRSKLAGVIIFTLILALCSLTAFAQGDDDLLPVGAKAPDFTLKQKGGGSVRLSRLLKTNKVILLNFWMIYCPPCREELPQLNEMQTRLRGKGLTVLSVNVMDSPADSTKFWNYNRLKMRMGLAGGQVASEKYHVTAVPANYLIGRNGKILARYVGYDAAGIRQTLAKAGIR